MEARIVDFWAGGATKNAQMQTYLEYLGFEVSLNQSATQYGVACGMVAAQNLVKLQFATDHLLEVNLSTSASLEWYAKGNEQLGITTPRYLKESEVLTLARLWLLEEAALRLVHLSFEEGTSGQVLPSQLTYEREEAEQGEQITESWDVISG